MVFENSEKLQKMETKVKESSSMDRILESTLSKTVQQLMMSGQELEPEKANHYK